MIRHASSHGLSILLTTVLSSFLIEVLRPLLPNLMNGFLSVSQKIVSMFRIPITPEVFNVIIVASIIGLIWGAFFRIGTRKKYVAVRP